MTICYHCETPTFPPIGNPDSSILIIASVPDKDSLENEYPFYIDTNSWYPKHTFSSILKKEMFDLGMDYEYMRKIYLWQHKPNKNETCFEVCYKNVLEESKGKKGILLLGAESVEYFSGFKVSDVSSLQVECNMLSAPVIFASYNPTIVYSHGVGELKLSLKNFRDKLVEEGVL